MHGVGEIVVGDAEAPAGRTGQIQGVDARLEHAVHGFARRHPEMSAALPIRRWQVIAFHLILSALVGVLALSNTAAGLTVTAVMSLPFACILVLRVLALWQQVGSAPGSKSVVPPIAADCDLPRYSVLVPLFREVAVVRQLVAGLERLDYPRDRLEILFVLESIDTDTLAVLRQQELPAYMRMVVVPDGLPRTKPRALNYALAEASGDIVVIYDAEDLPEADQMKRAAAAFAASDGRLGCLQARLNVYNPNASWLSRQFTIEYSALFDALLPTIERLGLPILLGGTSNHFPRAVLEQVGGWDAFNVTEDADLGIRLARFGWRVAMLDSTTWEEAPARMRDWNGQRTRWLKGWMQTYLVHMREPVRLMRDLGPRAFAGLQLIMGALLLSALVHPWFFVLGVPKVWVAGRYVTQTSALEFALLALIGFNLVGGYLAAILLGIKAVRERHSGIAKACWLMPFYWLAISVAAYQALAELARRPHHWQKTEHRGAWPAG